MRVEKWHSVALHQELSLLQHTNNIFLLESSTFAPLLRGQTGAIQMNEKAVFFS